MILMLCSLQTFLTNLYKGTKIVPSYLINRVESSSFEDRHALIAALDEVCNNDDVEDGAYTKEIKSISVYTIGEQVKVKINLCN